MTFSNWLSCSRTLRVAGMLVAIATISACSEDGGDKDDDLNAAAKQERIQYWASRSAEWEKQRRGRPYFPDCAHPSDHDEADLCQQRLMIDTASSQFRWGVAQAFFTVLATLASAYAAYAASRAAKAAFAANALQAKTAELELRPYVTREGIEYHWMYVRERPEELESWRIGVIWKNAGQTPARNVRARMNVDSISIGSTPEGINYADIGDFDAVVNPIGPSQAISSRLEVPLQKWIDAWEGRSNLYCWAWVEYDGIRAGTRHRTEACVLLIPKGDPRDRDNFKLVDAITTRFNALDDECVYPPTMATAA